MVTVNYVTVYDYYRLQAEIVRVPFPTVLSRDDLGYLVLRELRSPITETIPGCPQYPGILSNQTQF